MIQTTTVPTLGSLIGVSGSSNLLSRINDDLGGGNFFNSVDDILSKGRAMFVNNFIEPIRQLGRSIKKQIDGFSVADTFISITEEEQLEFIPTCMFDPILAYAPVKELFNQGRIFGFGYENAPEEDVWGRLIDNGRVDDVAASMDKKGEVEFNYLWKSTDPDLDFEELDCIEESRDFIDKILKETDIDVTDYPNRRG